MRTSIHTHRERQLERLRSLVARTAHTCTPDELLDLERLVLLVQAGELPARDAHARILAMHHADRRAA